MNNIPIVHSFLMVTVEFPCAGIQNQPQLSCYYYDCNALGGVGK